MNPKKKILIIGSSVADVIMNVKRLPAPGEDVHILNQRLCIGGCAFNVSDMIRHFSGASPAVFSGRNRDLWRFCQRRMGKTRDCLRPACP